MHQLYRPVLALALSAAAFSCAAAVPVYTKVVGKSLDFYYLSDAFAGGSAYAVGDNLMVQPGQGLSQLASNDFAVVAVAHNGHALTAGGGLAIQGYYSTTTVNSVFKLDGYFSTSNGSFSGGGYHDNGRGVSDALFLRTSPQPGKVTALWQADSAIHTDLGRFSAVGVYSRAWITFVEYPDQSRGDYGITGVMYSFDQVSVPLSPVPEPQTYGMLLAGLALLGAAALRRLGR